MDFIKREIILEKHSRLQRPFDLLLLYLMANKLRFSM